MSDRSSSSPQLTLWEWSSFTPSPASAAGVTPCVSPAGPTTAPSGPPRARASRSATPARASASTTSATSGPSCSSSSASADLQSFLASRLRAELASTGSPLYALTWKERATPSGLRIYALRASAPRTSGSVSTSSASGWPTATCNDASGSEYAYSGGDHSKIVLKLPGVAKLTAAWPTPTARDWRDGRSSAASEDIAGRPLNEVAVAVTGWPTARAADGAKGVCRAVAPDTGPDLPTVAGWATPRAEERQQRNSQDGGVALSAQVQAVAGWATPTANTPGGSADAHVERKRRAVASGARMGLSVTSLAHQAEGSGQTPSSSRAETASRGQLAPAFSLWLMGYPPAWESCAPPATRSSRRSPPRSSGR